jgi:hypothetical protein
MNEQSPPPVKFENPYLTVAEDDKEYHNIFITKNEARFIKGLRLSVGTMRTTLALLFQKLYHECTRRKFSNYEDADRFERFILDARIAHSDDVCPHCRGRLYDGATSGPLPEAETPHVGARVEGSSNGPTPVETERTDVQVGSGTKGKRNKSAIKAKA